MSVELYRQCRRLGLDYKTMFPSYVEVKVDDHSTGTHITVARNNTTLYYDSQWVSASYRFNDSNKQMGVRYEELKPMFAEIFAHMTEVCTTTQGRLEQEAKDRMEELARQKEIETREDINFVLKEYSCASSN